MSFVPYGRQDVSQADIDAVVEVLRSDWLTQGPAIVRFEEAVAAFTGARFAVAVCNATAALHIACLAAGLGKDDQLWTSPNTFVASANCGLYCGAGVDFVDIDPRTYNMDAGRLEQRIEQRRASGSRLPKIVIPVHFAGQSCDMTRIGALARQHGFSVIEDASHAVGASYLGRRVGALDHADMAVFSFHPVKIITTGEGGIVLTNRADLHAKLIRLRSHGITRDAALMTDAPDGAWYYQQIDLGFNYRITDVQAALGLSQLARLEDFVARRHALARRYDDALADLPVTLPWQHPDSHSAYHLYVVRVDERRAGRDRKAVFDALRAAGIGVNVHYIPVHTQPYYRTLGFRPGDFPESERHYREAISLPMYASLTEQDQDRVIDVLRRALRT